ncbi:MAG TPA: hypothetical protein VHV57_10180 [Acidimicrobiales bacterium]|jgi:hypothetical protein|nr:hypothetical protein [Acidimicrobiales bacterium]
MKPWLRAAVAAVVGLLAIVGIALTAVHAARSESHLATPALVHSATQSDAYFECLSTQAHSLVSAHDIVYLPKPTLANWVTLTKVIGGWVRLTLRPASSTVALALLHSTRGATCQGDYLVTIRRQSGGRALISRGRS